jgi:hypothetical protein
VDAQDGATPLYMACQNGHKEVVKLLLAHADVKINQADEVRGRREAGKERGQEWQAGVHTMVLRRRAAHLTLCRPMCDTACTCSYSGGATRMARGGVHGDRGSAQGCSVGGVGAVERYGAGSVTGVERRALTMLGALLVGVHRMESRHCWWPLRTATRR